MNYTFKAEAKDYTIPLGQDFNVIDLHRVNCAFEEVFAEPVDDEFESIEGVNSILYNSQWGNRFFVSLDVEHDTDEIKELISELLQEKAALYTRGNDSTNYEYVVKMSTFGPFPKKQTREDVANAFSNLIDAEIIKLNGESVTYTRDGVSSFEIVFREIESDDGLHSVELYLVEMKFDFLIKSDMTSF